LQSGELLISVPAFLQLTAYPSLVGSPCPELNKTLPEARQWHFQEESVLLLLRLLKEHVRGRGSVFQRYIATMPAEYPSILSDAKELQQCLAGTPARLKVSRRVARDRALGQLLRECNVATSESTMRWAKLTVNTRAFSGSLPGSHGVDSGRKEWNALVPFADIFNDAVSPNAAWSRDLDSGVFEVRAAQSIRKDGEVLISYGAKGNEKLLSSYGFVHADNPRDEVIVYLQDPSTSLAAPPFITLSLGRVDTGSLKQTLAGLQFLRTEAANTGRFASTRELESAVMVALKGHCARATVPWAANYTVSDSMRWACDGYRDGLINTVRALSEFADLAIADLEGKPRQPSAGLCGRLSSALLEEWRKEFAAKR